MSTTFKSSTGDLPSFERAWRESIPRETGLWRRPLQLIARQLPARVFEERSKSGATHLLFARYFVAAIPDWRIFGRLAGGRVYLHHYLQPDLIDALHNHPWELGVALPLAGGYLERRLIRYHHNTEGKWRIIEQVYDRKAFRPYRLTGADFHTITKLHANSSWSLFLHGKFTKPWGFISEDGDSVQFRAFPGQNKPEAKGNWWTNARRGSFYNAK